MSRTVYQYGAATIPPATIAPAASLLANCDPTLKGLLDGLSWALTNQLGAAYANAAVGFGGDKVVAETYAVDPIPEVARATWRWPALVAWRGEQRYGLRTLMYDGHETDVHLVYALPPMTLEFLQRLAHVRLAVVRTIRKFIEEKGHPDYLSGVNWLDAIRVDQLALVSATEGDAFPEADMQMRHVGVSMQLVLKEREEVNLTGIETLGETAYALDLGGPTEEPVEDFVAMSFEHAPATITMQLPAASFSAHVGDVLTIGGSASHASMIEVFASIDSGSFVSWGIVSIAAGVWTLKRTLQSTDAGAVQLYAVATGHLGEVSTAIVNGTIA